jgi:hypothetical protein
MASVDIPEDLWKFLQDHARRKRTKSADLLSKVLDDYRRRETTNRTTSLALKGYGARPEEGKPRSH